MPVQCPQPLSVASVVPMALGNSLSYLVREQCHTMRNGCLYLTVWIIGRILDAEWGLHRARNFKKDRQYLHAYERQEDGTWKVAAAMSGNQ